MHDNINKIELDARMTHKNILNKKSQNKEYTLFNLTCITFKNR